jgi:hypothetical protein
LIQENEEEISESNAVVDAIVDNHDDGEEMIIFTSDTLPCPSAHQPSLIDEAWSSFFCGDDDYATVFAQAARVTVSADDLSFPPEKQAPAPNVAQTDFGIVTSDDAADVSPLVPVPLLTPRPLQLTTLDPPGMLPPPHSAWGKEN